MFEFAQGLAFTLETFEHIRINNEFAGDDFERNMPSALCVSSAIDRAHRAFAEAGCDCVAVVEGLTNQIFSPGLLKPIQVPKLYIIPFTYGGCGRATQ